MTTRLPRFQCRQGDTGPVIDTGGLPLNGSTLDGNWSCRLVVRVDYDTAPVVDRVVTSQNETNTAFRAALTPDETTALSPGEYIVAIQVQNLSSAPPFRRERHYKLLVQQQAVV